MCNVTNCAHGPGIVTRARVKQTLHVCRRNRSELEELAWTRPRPRRARKPEVRVIETATRRACGASKAHDESAGAAVGLSRRAVHLLPVPTRNLRSPVSEWATAPPRASEPVSRHVLMQRVAKTCPALRQQRARRWRRRRVNTDAPYSPDTGGNSSHLLDRIPEARPSRASASRRLRGRLLLDCRRRSRCVRRSGCSPSRRK